MHKKTALPLVFILSAICSLHTLFSCAQVSNRKPLLNTIAVWKIENSSPLSTVGVDFGELFSDKIIDVINNKGRYRAVERERLLLVLEELNLSATPIVDETTQLKIGRMIGAQLFVFGAYQVISGAIRIDLRLVNVGTGQVLNSVSKVSNSGSVELWLEMVRHAASELL